jgi:hypothetical protein
MTEGDVIGWIVLDPESGEWCVRCETRAEARELAGRDGVIAKVVRAH